MSAHVAIETTSTTPRTASGGKSRVGETTGDCAAVCCCCPCAVVHLLVLAVYRLPAGIWRKHRRKRLLSKTTDNKLEINRRQSAADERGGECMHGGENYDAVGWDNEMWRRFYWGGFWRSDSRGADD
ncbi:uncharacterized protein LOC131000271 [Salvia miltiorrhiza]|uniref:uncharacterized protein LOC131000271 n=1 Tax=Salvia miltiorrhiza TaxID=226208 RepID=UPI0025ACC062|nr:uncharacterized protein LOC131000271 [Salvia miltiorrhiza]